MTLNNIDLDILEAAYYDEPWHILCGMVEEHFINIIDLIPKIFELQKNGLIDICRDPGTNIDPTPDQLIQIAINYKSNTTDWPEGPTWSIKTTEEGFKYIKDRFK